MALKLEMKIPFLPISENAGVVGTPTNMVDRNGKQLHVGDDVKVYDETGKKLLGISPVTDNIVMDADQNDERKFLVFGCGDCTFYETDGGENQIELVSKYTERFAGEVYTDFDIFVVEMNENEEE